MSHDSIRTINSIVLDIEKSAYRSSDVCIKDYEHDFVHVFPRPSKLLTKMTNLIESKKSIRSDATYLSEFHCSFIDIHPFIAGNGRTARMILDAILISYSKTPVFNTMTHKEPYYRAVRHYINTKDTSLFQQLVEDLLL